MGKNPIVDHTAYISANVCQVELTIYVTASVCFIYFIEHTTCVTNSPLCLVHFVDYIVYISMSSKSFSLFSLLTQPFTATVKLHDFLQGTGWLFLAWHNLFAVHCNCQVLLGSFKKTPHNSGYQVKFDSLQELLSF